MWIETLIEKFNPVALKNHEVENRQNKIDFFLQFSQYWPSEFVFWE